MLPSLPNPTFADMLRSNRVETPDSTRCMHASALREIVCGVLERYSGNQDLLPCHIIEKDLSKKKQLLWASSLGLAVGSLCVLRVTFVEDAARACLLAVGLRASEAIHLFNTSES